MTPISSINNMGAIQSNSAVYLSISDGKICRRVQSPTETSKERTTKEGKIVHEEFYKGWFGMIKNVKAHDSEYGRKWMVEVHDLTVTAILQFNYSSGYASSFLKALPNVDLNRAVAIKPNVTMIGDKKKTTIFLEQDGKAVKWFYTKDNPNGLPPMKLIKIKGVESWDDSEMLEYLEKKTAELFETTPF